MIAAIGPAVAGVVLILLGLAFLGEDRKTAFEYVVLSEVLLVFFGLLLIVAAVNEWRARR